MTRGMGFVVWTVMAACVAGAPSSAKAQEVRTIQGEIVDPATYLKTGGHGPAAANHTYEAVDGGQTLALLDEATGQLYLLLAEEPGEDPNELIYDAANQTLKVTGTVYERAGLKGIVVKSVEPLSPPSDSTEPAR